MLSWIFKCNGNFCYAKFPLRFQYCCAFSENLRVAFLVLRLSSMKGVGNVMFSAFARVLHVFARFLRLFARVLQVDFCSFSVLPANCP